MARRISVVGATGSGKSYLSRLLAKQLGLPHYELDRFRHDSGQEIQPEQFKEIAQELVSRDQWIIDGHYRLLRQAIWSRADMIVWLDYPLPIVAMRLVRRFAKKQRQRFLEGGRRKATAILPPEIRPKPIPATWPERLGRLIRTIRERREYGKLLLGDRYPDVCVVRLKSKRMRDQWLAQIGVSSRPGSELREPR